MRKLSTILMAVALVLGMAQCKKDQQPTPEEEILDNPVRITVSVGDNDRHLVIPNQGKYFYEQGDKLYVGTNGKYVGTLTFDDIEGAFKGTIYGEPNDDYLHFYFVGGLEPKNLSHSLPLTYNTTTSFDVDISDQTGNLPVLSYGHSDKIYTGQGKYKCRLLNKCALVEFDLSNNGTSYPVVVDGMKTEATVSFATPGITAKETRGSVKLHSKSNTRKWAILLPQDAVSTAPVYAFLNGFNSNSATAEIPPLTENSFIHGSSAISVASDQLTPPGSIPSKFTINANGDQVYFSQGNLQYIGSAAVPYWKFADNQWDCLLKSTGQNSDSQTVDRDLFGWGTSGCVNTTSPYNKPWCVDPQSPRAYGPGNGILQDKWDWGYNAIRNGGDTENSGWRTLTHREWGYLFDQRQASTVCGKSNARFAKARVENTYGVILFPDDYEHPEDGGEVSNINSSYQNYGNYSVSQFNAMLAAGAVFLPAAGYRRGTMVASMVGAPETANEGYYWSASPYSEDSAYRMTFTKDKLVSYSVIDPQRYYGYSVRLVFPAEN